MEVMLIGFFVVWMQFMILGKAVHPGCECLVYSTTHGKEMGTFTSPDFPKQYAQNIDCVLYTFIGRPNEIIQIVFLDFDIPKRSNDCIRGDYLKLFLHLNGGEVNEYTPWETVLCGSLVDIPTILYSSGPGLVLEFHSGNERSNSTGFSGTFRFMDRRLFKTGGQKVSGTTCDYQFSSTDSSSSSYGNFYSPKYPSSYPKNIKCSYLFRARNRERIQLVFEEISLQKGDISCLNRADIIRIYDGISPGDAAIKFLCNEGAEVEIFSTGSNLFVEFVANSDWPGHGFKARYQFLPIEDNFIDLDRFDHARPKLGPSVSETRSSCDLSFTSDLTKNGTISSPHYPDSYPPRTTCRYEFEGRGKERIRIQFIDFQLYSPQSYVGENCNNQDSVFAFVHVEGRTDKIDGFCGNFFPKPIMSNGPRLLLELQSVFGGQNTRGFKAIYTFTENYGITHGSQIPDYPCAFVYTCNESKSGYFHSPNYPGLYPRDTECHYFFYGNENELVQLKFDYFDVEGVQPCNSSSASDYIEFSNYMRIDSKYKRRCGQQSPFLINSERKFFRVTFRSNDRLDGHGFNASYVFLDKSEVNTIIVPNHTSSAEIKHVYYISNIILIIFFCKFK
ncbi:suppressor of lurcher protein 1-like [Onthophagus taurus]|uniref:suppressor of lurcher protein 1-like n=1 Tax=Onthophagus taurus TaxID=166361 RepID=UPI000C1FDEDC|nr:suppressor of lurcher protein 1-like [Onthophagus taurus]